MRDPIPVLPNHAAAIVQAALGRDRRVLLIGPPGSGKSTLMTAIADELERLERAATGLSADPGSPAFGIPGAVALGRRLNGEWRLIAQEPLCTLDAGRFRLPLLCAVRRLVDRCPPGVLLLDGPGVVRGVAGSELLFGIVEAARVDLVLTMTVPSRATALEEELSSLSVERYQIHASDEARRPGKRARARQRTAQWDACLVASEEHEIGLDRLAVIGTPPPRDEPAPWIGRQVALSRGSLVAMGEVVWMDAGRLNVRVTADPDGAETLLVRDARRGGDGLLESAAPFAPRSQIFLPPAELLPSTAPGRVLCPAGRVGGVDVALINGVFGDPLLHLRLRHRARSLLFDLGEGRRLSARVAHQVGDVFISHAHMDHLGGFLWLLRSRIGGYPPCRVYGPPGLADHIDGLIRGFLWDRVGEHGPVFDVNEVHGDVLHRSRLQAGRPGIEPLPTGSAIGGVIVRESGYQVRTVMLDHHTPVLAYAFEPDREIHVRKDRLQSSGLPPGPWLNELKQRLNEGDPKAMVDLPDGSSASAESLAGELVLITPGRRLVYATDLADTPGNRARLIELARNAHTLFLEAAFIEADIAHARMHGHLSARACGEIATAARVSRLVPFHFSPRYADDPQTLFDELEAACDRVLLPDPRPGRGFRDAPEKPGGPAR